MLYYNIIKLNEMRPLLALIASLLLTAPAAAGAPNVVATILPIQSLVAGVMEGVGEPSLLIGGGQSPHNYSLRPTDAQKLNRADIVFWVGENVETFLHDKMDDLDNDPIVVELLETPGLTLFKTRKGGIWDVGPDDHGSHSGHGHAEERHHHGGEDGHIWLDPVNARAMVSHISNTLSRKDPSNAARYRENAARMNQKLAGLTAEVEAELQAVRERPYIVFHDAFQYFERRFKTNAAGSIALDPSHPPGAKRLYEIRKRIVETSTGCVFREPQFNSKLVTSVTEGTRASVAVLDPIGAALSPGPDAYFGLVRQIAASIRECLLATE
jgi:zinc transport system substrate-binding protein